MLRSKKGLIRFRIKNGGFKIDISAKPVKWRLRTVTELELN